MSVDEHSGVSKGFLSSALAKLRDWEVFHVSGLETGHTMLRTNDAERDVKDAVRRGVGIDTV